jgi:hypothetical protein
MPTAPFKPVVQNPLQKAAQEIKNKGGFLGVKFPWPAGWKCDDEGYGVIKK